MPGGNIMREDLIDSYYHVYARGINKQQIFLNESDFNYFILLLGRYLSHLKEAHAGQRNYVNFSESIHLISYYLMSNHFHLLVYQIEQRAMANLMRSLLTSYSMYFNKKYQRKGQSALERRGYHLTATCCTSHSTFTSTQKNGRITIIHCLNSTLIKVAWTGSTRYQF